MAASETTIANLALQILGATRVTSIDDSESKSAREIKACYVSLRDSEMQKHPWNFAIKRTTLAPSAVEPDFEFANAFPLPADCLRVLPPNRNDLDWRFESHEGAPSILTNEGDTLEVVYISRITNTAVFHDCFDMMLAARIADHICEAITQSNQKKVDARDNYKQARSDAKKQNAFAKISGETPEDTWISVRR
jgi:hypothetical protein